MALATQTVEEFLGLPKRGMRIHYTAQINFDGFAGIIDTLGGITVDVPYFIEDYAYPTEDLGTTYIAFQPGPQRMDGATALIYARTRHYDSDFSRSQRQQQVLRAIVSELQQKNDIQRVRLVPRLLASVAGEDGSTPAVLTTMPIDRPDMLIGLVMLASGLQPENIGQLGITPDEVTLVSEIGSNLVWDPDSVHDQVTRFLQKPQPQPRPDSTE
jgi:LCP family protein required for cell wall assembly